MDNQPEGHRQEAHGSFIAQAGPYGTATINVAPPEPVTPQQRPPRAEHFTGRQDILDWLMAALQPAATVSLCGAGGMGKTALAAEAVYRLEESGELERRFPDGVVVHSFYGRPATSLALAHLVQSFLSGARDFSVEGAQRTLAGKQALLVLDGVEEAEDLPALLRLRGKCAVLITSRRRSDARGQRRDAGPLPAAEAIALLRQWAIEPPLSDETAELICRLVGRLPLAVQLAGRYLQSGVEAAEDYIAWLQTTPIEALSHGERREESVAVLLERSAAQLDATAQAALGVVGLLAAAPFPPELIAASLDLAKREARSALAALVNYGLLRRHGGNYLVNHALAHRYARRRIRPGPATEQRAAEAILTLAQAVNVERQPSDALPLLPHLQAAVDWEGVGETALGGRLCTEAGYQLDLLADYPGARPYYERALAIREKALGPDHPDTATSLNNLGWLYHDEGNIAAAVRLMRRALNILERTIPNHQNTAIVRQNLANMEAKLKA